MITKNVVGEYEAWFIGGAKPLDGSRQSGTRQLGYEKFLPHNHKGGLVLDKQPEFQQSKGYST
jgi:hypothetical protein